MTYFSESITMLSSFLFSFFLLFVWIPSIVVRFDKDDSSVLDKVFISLTHSTLFFMIAIHFLVAIRLLETITVVVLLVLSIIVLTRYYNRSRSVSLGIKTMTALFDLGENQSQWRVELRKLYRYLSDKILSQLITVKQTIIEHPLLIAAYLLVFGGIVVDRFGFSFTHARFAMSDPYTHLGWSKFMADMKIYEDGVYPYGFEAIITTLYYIFQVDMYETIRFIAPLVTILMMLSLVYALRKMFKIDHITVLLTIFLLAFSSAMMVGTPAILWRQISALSMEYTAIFLMPGITFFYLYFKTNKRMYLLLAAECYAISSFAHTFVTVTMTMAFIAVGIAYIGKLLKGKRFIRIIGYMGAAGFIGILFPIIGLLMGKSFHSSSINYVKDELESGERSLSVLQTLKAFYTEQVFIVLMCLVFIIYIIVRGSYRLLRKNNLLSNRDISPIVMAGFFLVMMTVGILLPKLGFQMLVPVDRQFVFLSMSSALAFGVGWGFLTKQIKKMNLKLIVQFLACSTIILGVFLVPDQKLDYPSSLPIQQYDDTTRGYLDIKENYPLKNWDIISTVTELGLILGHGYHTELWEFVRNIDNPDLKEIKFATPYVFLFIEKTPIDILNNIDFRPITPEEAEMPFPEAIIEQPLTEFYYYNLQNRRILMAKAYYWAENYLQNHNDMKVFMDTPNIKIYEIYQGKNTVILTKDREVGSR